MGFFGHDLKHPGAVLEDYWEGDVCVFLAEVFFVELEFSFLVCFQEMALNLLAPFYAFETVRFLPGGVEAVTIEELPDAFDFESFLHIFHGLELEDGSDVGENSHGNYFS